MKKFLITILALSCLALTPAERKIVERAKANLEAAQAEQKHSHDLADWAIKSNQEAWNYASQTGQAAEKAKKQAQEQANEMAKIKPVYDAVTRWWDLGAFVWGFQQLLKHLLILAIVAGVLAGALYALSFFFPVIGIGLRVAKSFFVRILKAVINRFRRKK